MLKLVKIAMALCNYDSACLFMCSYVEVVPCTIMNKDTNSNRLDTSLLVEKLPPPFRIKISFGESFAIFENGCEGPPCGTAVLIGQHLQDNSNTEFKRSIGGQLPHGGGGGRLEDMDSCFAYELEICSGELSGL